MAISSSKLLLLVICTATVACSELKGAGVRIDAGGSGGGGEAGDGELPKTTDARGSGGGGDEAGDGELPENVDALPHSDALPIVPPPDAEAPLDKCNLDSECPTGHCVDGVCCDTACDSKCNACNLLGKVGTCSRVPANAPEPHGRCIKAPPCGASGLCDMNGECALATKTETCGAPPSCKDAKYTPQSFCDGAGTCVNATAGVCPNGLICGEGMCKGSCAQDADCGFNSLYCEGTACQQKLANGMKCVAGKGNACTSGNCVDGVCCGSAGCGSCQACNLNRSGTCSPVMDGTLDPKGICQDQAPGMPCGTTGRCNGSGACAYYENGKPCGAGESCSTATYTAASKCDGKGTCMSQTAAACPNNLTCLSNTRCKDSCSTDSDCALASQYCSNGKCVAKLSNGVACGSGRCASGNCVGGVCCSTASCGSCQSCASGTCSAVPAGQPDPLNICVNQGAASCGNNGLCGTGGSCQKHACTCDGFAMPHPASAGLPNPASYTVGAGFVTDNVTNLAWEQPFSTATFTLPNANKFCADKGGGWRLPTLVELYSLVDFTKSNPSIDTGVFPNTPSDTAFWTSSAVANNTSSAWSLGFSIGSTFRDFEGYPNLVRCVRTVPASVGSAALLCYPAPRFTTGPTEVVDGKTGLTWQRGVAPRTKTWADAKAYCPTVGANFRLPSVKELMTIVDLTKISPAIDTAAFLNTLGTEFWTSSEVVGIPGAPEARIVHFLVGTAWDSAVGDSLQVRCVR